MIKFSITRRKVLKPGDLVRITRPSIDIPEGSLGLIIEKKGESWNGRGSPIFLVSLIGTKAYRVRRYIPHDLEVVE